MQTFDLPALERDCTSPYSLFVRTIQNLTVRSKQAPEWLMQLYKPQVHPPSYEAISHGRLTLATNPALTRGRLALERPQAEGFEQTEDRPPIMRAGNGHLGRNLDDMLDTTGT